MRKSQYKPNEFGKICRKTEEKRLVAKQLAEHKCQENKSTTDELLLGIFNKLDSIEKLLTKKEKPRRRFF